MGVSFDSEESFEIEREMFRVIYHTAMSTSIDLAVKFGKYDPFEGSPPSEGFASSKFMAEFRHREGLHPAHIRRLGRSPYRVKTHGSTQSS
jgi:ribonucleotide reductase alpha subunit